MTGPWSAARFKPELHPQNCNPGVHARSKLTKCPEQEQEQQEQLK